MKKFLVVAAIVAMPVAGFAGGACPAPCAPACPPKACAPCFNPLAPVVGLVQGVGCAVGSVVNGIAGIFSCSPCQ